VAATPSIKVVKTITFKGGVRTYSNRYHFNGGTPADVAHWHTLMDNVVAAEHPALVNTNTITECVGYAAGSDVPVATKVYATAGTVTGAGTSQLVPGEVAALVRFSTAARTTKNHPIYLFNYYHSVYNVDTNASTVDKIDPNERTALGTYASAWIAGFSDGTITAVRASPNGAAATGSVVEEYLTHRDFPYSPSV
jgi:hypothetical protein